MKVSLILFAIALAWISPGYAMPILTIDIPIESPISPLAPPDPKTLAAIGKLFQPIQTTTQQSATHDTQPTEKRVYDNQIPLKEVLRYVSSGVSLSTPGSSTSNARIQTGRTQHSGYSGKDLLHEFLNTLNVDIDVFDSVRSLFGHNNDNIITLDGQIIDLAQQADVEPYESSNTASDTFDDPYYEDDTSLGAYINQWTNTFLEIITHPLAIAIGVVFLLFLLPVILLLQRNRRH